MCGEMQEGFLASLRGEGLLFQPCRATRGGRIGGLPTGHGSSWRVGRSKRACSWVLRRARPIEAKGLMSREDSIRNPAKPQGVPKRRRDSSLGEGEGGGGGRGLRGEIDGEAIGANLGGFCRHASSLAEPW